MKYLSLILCLSSFLWNGIPAAYGQLIVNQQGNDSLWDGRFRQVGATNNLVEALLADSAYLYAAGGYTSYGGNPLVRSLVRFDGDKWENIGGDFNCTSCGFGFQRALAQDAQGRLYVGGIFEGADNLDGSQVNSQNIIRWDPVAQIWEALGLGVEGQVRALAIDGDTLYVGGDLSAVYNLNDTLPVQHIARYFLHTNTWDSIPGGGVGSTQGGIGAGRVEALAVGLNHEVYIGGNLLDIAGPITQNVNSIASWHPANGWSSMNGGLPNVNPNIFSSPSTVLSLAVDPQNGNLYAGGQFGIVNTDTNNLAVWTGSQWNRIQGMENSHTVRALYVDTIVNKLYVGGDFGFDKITPSQNEMIGNRIGVLNLSNGQWESWKNGITQGGGPYAITRWKDDVYLGGSITEIDSLKPKSLVSWTGTDWNLLGEGSNTTGDQVRALLQDGDTVYAGGVFTYLGGRKAYGLARWDPLQGWQELGGGIYRSASQAGFVYALHRIGDTLLIGGDFNQLGDGTLTENIAAFHLPTQSWISFGSGTSSAPGNAVHAIESFQGGWVIGGNFSSIDGQTAGNLARYSGGSWTVPGTTNQIVESLANWSDSLLLIGGYFTQVNGNTSPAIATWDGIQWGSFHQGLQFFSRVRAIAIDTTAGQAYLAGFINSAPQVGGGSINVKSLIAWDGQQWTNPGNLGLGSLTGNPNLFAMELGADGVLYVGGRFLSADSISTLRVARRHPSGVWAHWGAVSIRMIPLPSRVRLWFRPLSVNHTSLFVGGTFYAVGDKQASNIARYELDPFFGCAGPTAGFSAQSTGLFDIQFQNLSQTIGNVSYFWDFGDGNSSSLPAPQHSYAFADSFLVSLIVSDSCGQDTLTQWVEIICNGPQAGFSFTQSGIFQVQFQNQSQNTGNATYLWDFGDGNSSNLLNPQHTYAFADSFLVSLIVSDSCGQDTLTQWVEIICNAPQAGFSWTIGSSFQVQFQDISQGTGISSWAWDFGDGNSSTISNPQHTFTGPGNYTVCLIIGDACGLDTLCQSLEITCDPADLPLAAFGVQMDSLDLSVQFSDLSLNAEQYNWDFGDGTTDTAANPVHHYAESGTYEVCLIVSSVCGQDTICQTLEVVCKKPTASFYYMPGDSLTVEFMADTAGIQVDDWIWDFGNGDTSTALNPVYEYTTADSFWVSLIVRNECGADTLQQLINLSSVSIASITEVQVQFYPNPVQDVLFIRANELRGNKCRMVLYDGLGKVVLVQEMPLIGGRLAQKVDFSALAAGMYVLDLQGQNWHLSKKIMH